MRKMYLLTFILYYASMPCFAQWGQVNNGIANLTLGAKLLGSSNTHVFAGSLKMYRTSDNGSNWVEIQPPVAGNIPECGYYVGERYFAGLNSSMNCVFYSTDNGTSWNSVTGGPQTTVVRGFIGVSGNIFAYTSSVGIYKSTDGGSTWSASNSGLTNLNVSKMETVNTTLIASTIGGGVFVSTDNGTTWIQSNTGIAGGDLNAELVWRMGTNLYYTAQGGAFYTSSNQGASWSSWSKPSVMGLSVNEIHRNGSNLYLESRHFSGGLRDSIYMTADEGASWSNITGNLSASDLNASGITEHGGFVFIAYNLISPNLGIYRKATTTVGIEENRLSDYVSIYPNPCNDKIVLTNSSAVGIKKVFIYDNLGKLVLLEHVLSDYINTTDLNEGLYFVSVVFTNGTSVTRTVIKEGISR